MAVNSFNAQNPPVNTKGDLFTFSTIPTKLGVGSNNQVLTADSTTSTGLKWATAASGGMTLIATATPSAATTVQFAAIPTTYKALLLVWNGIYQSATNVYFKVQLNGDSSALYDYCGTSRSGSSFVYRDVLGDTDFGAGVEYGPIPSTTTSSSAYTYQANGSMIIYNSDQTTGVKTVEWGSNGFETSGFTPQAAVRYFGVYRGTSAISQIDFLRSSTQTITGTIRLYGVA